MDCEVGLLNGVNVTLCSQNVVRMCHFKPHYLSPNDNKITIHVYLSTSSILEEHILNQLNYEFSEKTINGIHYPNKTFLD